MNTNTTLTTNFVKPNSFNEGGISYLVSSSSTVKVIQNIKNSYSGIITIPETVIHHNLSYSVTEIDETAFKNNKDITEINIGNNITTIKAFSFSYCKNLKSITIPNSVTSIENSAFSASGLTNFTFPSTVTSVEAYLLFGCKNLTTVTIPSNITTIKEYAFGWCSKLTTLMCAIESPVKIHSNVFFETPINSCTLKVPASKLKIYKTQNIWENFSLI